MRVLLVTETTALSKNLAILNPELEYCAIVVDEVEPAKKILEQVKLSPQLLHPLDSLKECVTLDFDYVVCLESKWSSDAFTKAVQQCGLKRDKIIPFNDVQKKTNFFLERSIRYFKEHATEYQAFATGISCTEQGLDVTKFKLKTFNFGRGSQDFYYNFQVAKKVVSYWQGQDKSHYALIGVPVYGFHYDMSKTPRNQFLMFQHFIVFRDLHNSAVPADAYQKIFREEYLSKKIPLEPINLNDPYLTGKSRPRYASVVKWEPSMMPIRKWDNRFFPTVRDENIKILDDYLTFCEENTIRPIMFLVPSPKTYQTSFNKRIIEEFNSLIEQALKKHPKAHFVDGWKLAGFTDEYFFDVLHLNAQGAAKFSEYLSNFIERLESEGGEV